MLNERHGMFNLSSCFRAHCCQIVPSDTKRSLTSVLSRLGGHGGRAVASTYDAFGWGCLRGMERTTSKYDTPLNCRARAVTAPTITAHARFVCSRSKSTALLHNHCATIRSPVHACIAIPWGLRLIAREGHDVEVLHHLPPSSDQRPLETCVGVYVWWGSCSATTKHMQPIETHVPGLAGLDVNDEHDAAIEALRVT